MGVRLGSSDGIAVLDALGAGRSVAEAVALGVRLGSSVVGESVPVEVALGEGVGDALALGVRLGIKVADGWTLEVGLGVGDALAAWVAARIAVGEAACSSAVVGLGGREVGCGRFCPGRGVTVRTGVCSRTVSVETLRATSVGETPLSSQ